MQGIPDRAWAKLSRSNAKESPLAWHPLVDHSADVAATLEALLRQTILGSRLFTLGKKPGADDERLIQRLGVITFLHDIGKANRGFQNKRWLPPGVRRGHGIETAGHVRELYPLLEGEPTLRERLRKTLPLDKLCEWVEDQAFLPLLVASVSHHGTPWNMRDPCPCRHLWFPGPDGYDPFTALRELANQLRQWFPAAFEAGGASLPNAAPFQHAFAGLVMLADWLGSHTGFFPFSEPGDSDRMPFARERACVALAAVGLAVETPRAALRALSPPFETVFPPFKPKPMQLATGQLTKSHLVVLEAETGSGKTEAALWRFKQLFEAGEVDGLCFALPTRVAASQIHKRVREAVARLWPDASNRPGVLLAVPGYVKVDEAEANKILPGFEVLWTDHPGEAEAHKRWAGENPKRFLAAPIAVGTIDQALLSNLRIRHAHLRSSALLRHLLIIDEVHASDPYMTALLQTVLETHLDAGGHALLMSATLGSAARSRFLLGDRGSKPTLVNAIAVPYPALSSADGGGECRVAFKGNDREKRVHVQLRPLIDDAAALAQEALAAARAGAKVLVVRNTVATAVAIQRALEALITAEEDRSDDHALLFRCQGIPTLHHGRFAREDRKLLDSAVETRLGRKRPTGGAVVIGTQTLEQSLDIDADLLITDLCPMDVLLQRIGRLHRHERDDRPPGFREPLCIVSTPADRDLTPLLRRGRHGLGGFVYPDLRVVEATWRRLIEQSELVIPAMNRDLVERTTHGEALATIESNLGKAWAELGRNIAGKTAARGGCAYAHGIDRRRPFGDWTFPSLDETIRTRLGADDRLVDWQVAGSEPPTGPFGRKVHAFTIPNHLCRDIAPDVTPSIPEECPGGFAFMLGTRRFQYDRHGLSPVQEGG